MQSSGVRAETLLALDGEAFRAVFPRAAIIDGRGQVIAAGASLTNQGWAIGGNLAENGWSIIRPSYSREADCHTGCPIEFQDSAANRIPGTIRRISDSERYLFQRTDKNLPAANAAAEAVGVAQKALLEHCLQDSRIEIELFFQPLHEAGGDFLGHYDFGTDCAAVILTDVSGHDLQAAMMSAFFHGLVRGALAQNASLSAALDQCNKHLVNWHDGDISIAATALLFDSGARTVRVGCCGAPSPMYIDHAGRAHRIGGNSPPLGWFDPLQTAEAELTYETGSHILVWTDGVEALAASLRVSPSGLPCQLFRAERIGHLPEWLSSASDDILVSCVRPPGVERRECNLCPHVIVWERYASIDANLIDEHQRLWAASLSMAFEFLGPEEKFNILLCTREAVLNAVTHGCRGDDEATLQITWLPGADTLRVIVEDPGPGHSFVCDSRETELPEKHRGLLLMAGLSDRFRTERNGATVVLDFFPVCRSSLHDSRLPSGIQNIDCPCLG